MKPLVIFDLDGTLIDSAPDIILSVNEMLAERSHPPLADAVVKAAIGEGLKMLIERLFPDRTEDAPFIAGLQNDFARVYEGNLTRTTRPYPGVVEFLETTKYPVALVTNKSEKFTRKTFAALGLDRYPWVCCFSGDTFALRKPDPFPLREAMARASVGPENTVMVGDGIPDMLAAKSAGVRAIACDYGYTDPIILRELGAERSIASFSEVNSLLAEMFSCPAVI